MHRQLYNVFRALVCGSNYLHISCCSTGQLSVLLSTTDDTVLGKLQFAFSSSQTSYGHNLLVIRI